MSDDVTLNLAAGVYGGWTEITIDAGIQQGTRAFQIGVTNKFPSDATELFSAPGDACQVQIGEDLVVTGFLNRDLPGVTKETHPITLSGRGKCQDLIDCSAEWPSCQIGGSTALGIAQKLAQPYGITVSGETGLQIPQFNITVTETPWDIIDRITRYSQLLAYEQADGSLIFSTVGQTRAASGFAEGQNGIEWHYDQSDDQRYSDYVAYLMAFDPGGDIGAGNSILASVTDPNVKRHRLLKIVAESGGGLTPTQIAQQRVTWEMNHRAGRSRVLTVTADSWRDGAGALWQPNTIAPVNFPSVKLPQQDLLIAHVRFSLNNETGKTAIITLMPPEAFAPEPIILDPVFADVSQAIQNTAP